MSYINEQYQLVDSIFQNNSDRIIKDILNSSYPLSNKALFNLQIKIKSLLRAMEAIAEESNYYSICCMSRVVIEHFLVSHYIFLRTFSEKSDDCGEEYYNVYRNSEILKRWNYNLKVEGIKKNIKVNGTLDEFKKKFPQYKDLTQQEVDNIHRIGNQFSDVKTIFNYIINRFPKGGVFDKTNEEFIDFLQQYNTLSSYIHGGPTAEMETTNNLTDKQSKIAQSVDLSKIACKSIQNNVLILLLYEKNQNFEFYKELIAPILNLGENSII